MNIDSHWRKRYYYARKVFRFSRKHRLRAALVVVLAAGVWVFYPQVVEILAR